MKLAAYEYNAPNNIPDSVVCKPRRMTAGDARNWLAEILATYSTEQLDVVVNFLEEMSLVEWQHQDPDLSADAAKLHQERFRRLGSSPEETP